MIGNPNINITFAARYVLSYGKRKPRPGRPLFLEWLILYKLVLHNSSMKYAEGDLFPRQ